MRSKQKHNLGSSNYKNKEGIIKLGDNFVLSKFPVLSLLLIGISAISIRLIFFQNELIFSSDNMTYFQYAMDVSLTGKLPTAYIVPNNGWPLLL